MTAFDDQMSKQRLLQISEEVRRIASSLSNTAAQISSPAPPADNPPPAPDVPLEAVRSIIQARRLRERLLKDVPFADPAWDMILDLFEAELSNRRVAVSSLCIGAGVPATTALRWIRTLCEKGAIIRRNDPLDGRRVFVELSPEMSRSVRFLFAGLNAPIV